MKHGLSFDSHQPRPAGHIFLLPSQHVYSSDRKNRGYILLRSCTPPEDGTLAYRSRQTTEATVYKAACYPPPPAPPRPGRRERPSPEVSYYYPSRLLYWRARELTRSMGADTAAVLGVRHALRSALGIGEGISELRGHIARMTTATLRTLGFRWAVVLTHPDYAAAHRWQTVVPIFGNQRGAGPDDLSSAEGAGWVSVLNAAWTGAVMAIPLTCSVSELDGHVEAILPTTVDADTLTALEIQLVAYFQLP